MSRHNFSVDVSQHQKPKERVVLFKIGILTRYRPKRSRQVSNLEDEIKELDRQVMTYAGVYPSTVERAILPKTSQ